MTASRVRLLGDENFDARLVAGLRARLPGVDLLTIHEMNACGTPDADVLAIAAADARVLLTHDRRTMITEVYVRVGGGLPMPGAIFVPQRHPLGLSLADLVTLIRSKGPDDLRDQVVYVPLDKAWRIAETGPAYATA